MVTKKLELTRFRNLTKGRLIQMKSQIENILLNMPSDCESLDQDEKEILLNIKRSLSYILGPWSHRSKNFIKKV